jgi:murein DD-endopeptidase MepM/ murein hydrolase activator NlpD
MHLIITDAWMAKTRPIHLSSTQIVMATLGAALALMLLAAALYHWVFLKGAREGWPLVGSFVQLVIKDESAQRERFMRENLDVMAKKVGEMQARIVQLEAATERVGGLTGVQIPATAKLGGRGGALVDGRPLTMEELQNTLVQLDELSSQKIDLLTLMESKLFEQRMQKLLVPTSQPVPGSNLGSSFGFRIDPINGRQALHTGLDFQAPQGTPILAAAGGVVVTQEYHPAYGNMVEVDHGNELVTRYAHAHETFVKKGDIVKRGQKVATVGSTGRSTGPHLHFEVLVQGVPQDPQKFLTAGEKLPGDMLAADPKAGSLAPTAKR